MVVSYYGHVFDFPWAFRSNKEHSRRFYGVGRFIWDVQDQVYLRSVGKNIKMWDAAGMNGEKIRPVMSGRIMFDLLDYLANLIEKFPSYKLDWFAQEWLGEGKAGFDRKIDIPLAWHGGLPRENYNEIVGEDNALPDGVEPTHLQQRAALRNYCVYDSVLPIRIILARFEGQMRATATLTYVPLGDVINKKKLRLIISKVTDVAWSINAMINVLDADLPTDKYDGGHVFEPKAGYYGEGDPNLPLMDPQPTPKGKVCYDDIPQELLKWYELAVTVPTQDFKALYPSVMLAFGVCIMRFLDDDSHPRRLYPSEQSMLDFCKKFDLDPPLPSVPAKGLPIMSDMEMRIHGPGVWFDAPDKDDYTAVISYNPKKPEKAPKMHRFSKRWDGVFVPMLRSVLDSRFKKKKLGKKFGKAKEVIENLHQDGDNDDARAALGFLSDMKELDKLGPHMWLSQKRELIGPNTPFPHKATVVALERHITVVDFQQLADKGLANSTYGGTAFGNSPTPVSCRPVASSICAIGRQLLIMSHDKVLEKYKGTVDEIIYGDSVTGNTPVLIRHDSGHLRFVQIEDLGKRPWKQYHGGKEAIEVDSCIEVWSDKGWTKVRRVIRHHTTKNMCLVRTKFGMVECTEDHSLLCENGTPIRPYDITPKSPPLLHTDHPFPIEGETPDDLGLGARLGMMTKHMDVDLEEQEMLFASWKTLERYVIARYGSVESLWSVRKRTKLGAAQLSYMAARLKASTGYIMLDDDMYRLGQNICGKTRVEVVGPSKGWVYDLDTECSHFAVGPGTLVVHNTDSIMLKVVGKTFKDSFAFGTEVENYLTNDVFGAWPDIVMEFETLEYKFLSVGKKRYATESYASMDKPPESKVKGLAVVRGGDFPPVCTMMMQTLLDICDECGGLVIEAITLISVLALGRHLEMILDGTMPLEKYILAKSIGTIDPKGKTAPEHLRVARKMEKRFGIPVVEKAKIMYVYIIGDNDGVDHPTCIEYSQLDRLRYLEQRIRNTISEIMVLMKVPPNTVHSIFDMYSKALSEQISPAVRGGFFKPSTQTAEERLQRCVHLLHHPPEVMPMRKRTAATLKALKPKQDEIKQASVSDFFALAKKKKKIDNASSSSDASPAPVPVEQGIARMDAQ